MYQIFKLVAPEATRKIDDSGYNNRIIDRLSLESVDIWWKQEFESYAEAEKELRDAKKGEWWDFIILNIISTR